MRACDRINSIPPYMFAKLDRIKREMQSKGYEVIDLSVGDPDLPVPDFIIESLKEGLKVEKFHKYPPYEGIFEFRKAVADYYKRRYNVDLDPEREVAALIGSKEGIVHLTLSLIDYGDTAIVPDPGYPIYKASVHLAGGKPYTMQLKRENSFLPDIKEINDRIVRTAKLMYINYPNNPTGSVCDIEVLRNLVEFAEENDIVVCNDAAYNEIIFKNEKPLSIINADTGKKVSIEFGTLSKSYNMTGWRIGYAVGNSDIIKRLMIVKSNTDSGQFAAIQYAASSALNYGDEYIDYCKGIYRERRDKALLLLKRAGIDAVTPEGTFYVWFKVPGAVSSSQFASNLIEKKGVLITPGNAFGIFGEGYCRIALTVDNDMLEKAVEKIKQSIWN
jgi:LL-diaminopimelate aminotransferase